MAQSNWTFFSMKLAAVVIKNASILLDLIRADFKNRYLSHYLGVMWAFIQPLIMVAVYWFVFTKGFGVAKVSGTSFLLWLFAGMVPWFLLSDAIINGSYSISSQAYLVKKIVFEVRLLPLIKIGSSLMVNAGFWGFLFILCLYNHHYPTLLWLQLVYYLICIIALSLVLSVFFSAVMPFVADLGQIINILFQVLFWITPLPGITIYFHHLGY